jgi:Ca2+-transporting ATPase
MKDNNNFYSKSVEGSLKALSSNIEGLSKKEAKIRLDLFGLNKIAEKKTNHSFLIFVKQFNSPFIYILVIAAIISLIFNYLIDVYVIGAVILINVTIGFLQEYKAERSIQALKKMIVSYAKVLREGELLKIPADELVPGDIVLLEEGDNIPADGRLIELKNFRTQEASLTGESLPADKILNSLSAKTSLADRKNMVWMGTFVSSGEAKCLVTKTGESTEIGQIAKDIGKIKETEGHFEKKINKLAKQMGIIAVLSVLVIFLVGFFIRGFDFKDIFLFSIASLVSAIPEGLPAILVIILSVGAHRMAKRNAIIRKLPATETLGAVTVIATDKTGTLTENTLTVESIIVPQGKEINVSGAGWGTDGNFYQSDDEIFPLKNSQLSKLLHISALCNNARVIKKENNEKKYEIIGDPTEAALIVLAEKAGIKKEIIEEKEKVIDDIPFNSELKYRASLSLPIEDGAKEVYVVGAPETILEKSSHMLGRAGEQRLTSKEKQEFFSGTHKLAKEAMRVLGIAYKKVNKKTDNLENDLINDLVFVGVLGMRDLPRTGIKEAIYKAKKAGIRVIMKTGDHKETATAIAKEIGLVDEGNKGKFPLALTEQELLSLSEKKFEEAVKNVSVFARLTPKTKLRIVKVLQKQGEIVAMTGDGVNDAPALKKADIGISMGVVGTDVARESSDMVLADDNFVSIVNAVEEGRIIFNNTRRSSFFLITTNFAEVLTLVSTLFLGLPLPLLPTQILWLNLVTDTGSGLGLSLEPGHKGIIGESPRKKEENILSKDIIPFLLLIVIIMIVVTVSCFYYFLPQGIEKARTGAFMVMSLTQLFNALNMRSLRKSVFQLGIFSNRSLVIGLIASFMLVLAVIYLPFLQDIFKFTNLNYKELLLIIFISSSVLWFGELYKYIKNKT